MRHVRHFLTILGSRFRRRLYFPYFIGQTVPSIGYTRQLIFSCSIEESQMLNFLSRIDQYMTNNMHEHGRYLLWLELHDEHSCKADRPHDVSRTTAANDGRREVAVAKAA